MKQIHSILLMTLLLSLLLIASVAFHFGGDSSAKATAYESETELCSTEEETTHTTTTITTIQFTTTSTTTTTVTLAVSCQLDVSAIYQNPELPTGCEVTSLACVLRYLGFDASKTDLADNYLITTMDENCLFTEAFVGSPRIGNSFGCFAPVIVKTAKHYLIDQNADEDYEVLDLSGSDVEDLMLQIQEGNPVIVWATSYMVASERKYYWTTPEGEDVYWYINEHCLVLTGFDQKRHIFYFADPQRGNITYDITTFTNRYEELEQQAVIIRRKTDDETEKS